MSNPIPSMKPILSIKVDCWQSYVRALKVFIIIRIFLSWYKENSMKYKAFLRPEKTMKDFGTNEDFV